MKKKLSYNISTSTITINNNNNRTIPQRHKNSLTITGADSHSSHAAGQAAGSEGPIERHRRVFGRTLAQLVQVCKQGEVDH